jgi:metal-responsive CopG/Arc/MetJ family transcriptional regulator
MPVRKIAISLPEAVLKRVDRLAKRTQTTRSGFISRVLSDVSHASDQAQVTARINRLFAPEHEAGLNAEQAETSRFYLQVSEADGEEGEW